MSDPEQISCSLCRKGVLVPYAYPSIPVRTESAIGHVPDVPAQRCDNPECGEITFLPESLDYVREAAAEQVGTSLSQDDSFDG